MQRVGAVTRIGNNIKELLPNEQQNKMEINKLLKKMEIKMEVFKDMCEYELLKNGSKEEKSTFKKQFQNHFDTTRFFNITHQRVKSIAYKIQVMMTSRSVIEPL